MQKNWSTYRITLLLYLGILILPFGFYTIYNTFEKIEKDAYTLIQLHKNHANILQVTQTVDIQKRTMLIESINKNFSTIKPWFYKNVNNVFYVGGKSPKEDFIQVANAWGKVQKTLDTTKHSDILYEYSKNMHSLLFNMSKMVLLAKDKVYNILYLTSAITIILFLLLIYAVRSYIHYQLTKDSIYDKETNLYNKRYFTEYAFSLCSTAQRHQYPLSVLFVILDRFDIKKLDKEQSTLFLAQLGEIFNGVMRDGDIACRYDKTKFAILLPFTTEEKVMHLKKRLNDTLEKQHFNVISKPIFKYVITQFDVNETYEAFTLRSDEAIQ